MREFKYKYQLLLYWKPIQKRMQQQSSQSQLGPTTEIFEISEIPKSIILKIKITDQAIRILTEPLR